jgi:hypothetical protein
MACDSLDCDFESPDFTGRVRAAGVVILGLGAMMVFLTEKQGSSINCTKEYYIDFRSFAREKLNKIGQL